MAGGAFEDDQVDRSLQVPFVGLSRPDPLSAEAQLVLGDGHLHSDSDEICPRCLQWIEGRDFVRRTAWGLLQHEVCPLDLTAC